MGKVLVILGEFVFNETEDCKPVSAIINFIQTTVYIEPEKASKFGEFCIENNLSDGYLIPSLYKGKIIFNT